MATTVQPDSELKTELNRLWGTGDRATFCARVLDSLAPEIHRSLRRYSGGDLSAEDCEDCFNEALEGLVMRDDGAPPVTDAVAYLWRSAYNAANSLFKYYGKESGAQLELRRTLRVDRGRRKRALRPESTEPQAESTEIPEDIAAILIEEMLELEPEPSVACRAVQIAVTRLNPALREVAQHLMRFGAEYTSSDAPVDLGLSPDTFRKRKQRLFECLPKLVLDALRELGAETKAVEFTALFTEPTAIPTDEPE